MRLLLAIMAVQTAYAFYLGYKCAEYKNITDKVWAAIGYTLLGLLLSTAAALLVNLPYAFILGHIF